LSEEWEFYPLLVDDSPASIFFDLGIRSEAPLAGYSWLGYLRVRMRQPRPDGLSSSEEFDALAALEDDVCESVTASEVTIYVGRNTSDGNRDFYFYTRNKSFFEKTASAAMSGDTGVLLAGGLAHPCHWPDWLPESTVEPRSKQSYVLSRPEDRQTGVQL